MMRTRSLAARSAKIFAVPLLLAGAAAGMASATPAAAATAGTQAPQASVPFSGQLNSATVAPGGTAWAVGYTNGEALPEHWNGKDWTFKPDLNVAPSGDFYSVAAISAGNAWAVGYLPSGSATVSLIAHWNGTAWKRVPSPDPVRHGDDELYGVAAVSATSAWAVGYGATGTSSAAVILHWNGTAWLPVACQR